MPGFKSEKHRQKIAQLEKEGKVKKGTSEAWTKETKGKLPERVTPSGRPTSIKQIEQIRIKRYGK